MKLRLFLVAFTFPVLSQNLPCLTSDEKANAWVLLFDNKSLDGWRPYGKPAGTPIGEGWKIEEGLLHKIPGVKGGDIISEKQFTDFELVWEWRLAKDANNGVKYCVTEARPGAPCLVHGVAQKSVAETPPDDMRHQPEIAEIDVG